MLFREAAIVTEFAVEMDAGTTMVPQELCTFLAKHCGVPQSHESVLRGAAAQRKTVRILEQ